MEDWQYKPAGDFGLPPSERLRSLRRESGLIGVTLSHAWWATVRVYLTLCHRLRIVGRENLPAKAPFVLIANHCSHLDVMCMAAALPPRLRHRTFPIAAGDTFFETPTRSLFSAGILNALPMWRNNCGRHAMDDLRARLADGDCIYILFPEGTRSRTSEMAPFKPGLGMIIAETPTPVVPCYISGTFGALPPTRKLPRLRRLAVHIGPPLTFADVPNRRRGWEQIAEQLEAAVRALAQHGN